MGMGMTSTSTQVTISGAVTANPSPTKLGTGQTFKSFTFYGVKNAGTDTTLYTVTALKTFYLTSILIQNGSGADTTAGIRDGAGGADMVLANCYNLLGNPTFVFPVPVPFTSLVNLHIGAGNGTFCICGQGYEE